MKTYDCIILGGGPAGLSVAATLKEEGFDVAVVERKHTGYNVSRFPICMRFFSSRDLVELNNFSLTIPDDKPTREQYMTYLYHFVQRKEITVIDYTNIEKVEKIKEAFHLSGKDARGNSVQFLSKAVVVAVGALDHPQMLNVEGEDLPHVTHYFNEIYPYIGHRVLVVGSGNGAVETALLLYRGGATVSLSHRSSQLNGKKIKYWMYPDILKRLEKGEIENLSQTEIEKIDQQKVLFSKTSENPKTEKFEKEFDFVVLQTGYEPPVGFLSQMGIDIDPESKIPKHDEQNLETNISGLFVAGAIVGGNVSGKVFIENSRFHGGQILPRLKEII
ncbi:MAG: NAD(P)-binding domain-containing protein [Leptospirales bacterium]